MKGELEQLYAKCRLFMDLLNEERVQNDKLLQGELGERLAGYRDMIAAHDHRQRENIDELEELEFDLFCENEDLMMVRKVLARIRELANEEENYQELKDVEEQFQRQV